jgi:omega-hydroxy-beta-dihydromenaquinone-9 sulfotransferase
MPLPFSSSRLKHRWSLAHNFLAGTTAGIWRRLLRENPSGVDAVYWHRAAFITAASWMNSWYRLRESRLFDAQVAKIAIEPPLFILGHWRSGTTHLHYLTAQDTEQFGFANTYQVVNPGTFLCTEAMNAKRFSWMVPEKRPMDNMALSFQVPQEDEFAPCLLSLRSMYLGMSFTRREDYYLRYLTFREVPPEEIEEWKTAFTWFLKKLTFKLRRPLVLKSPPHTARIRLLLELFPRARFVHIHRDPCAVFQSCQHYFNTAAWHTYLQRPDLPGINDRILRRYTLLHDSYFAERRLIPEKQFHEMAFADLERDPLGEMQKMYEKLGLSGFERFQPQLRKYVDSLAGYRKNTFRELEPEWRRKVGLAWQRSFDEWHYST